MYGHVSPRYLRPREFKPPQPLAYLPPREQIPPNPTLSHVPSRYLSEKKGAVRRFEIQIPSSPPLDPEHESMVKKSGLRAVGSRYKDKMMAELEKAKEHSPRHYIEQRRQDLKREIGWHTAISYKPKVFDDLRKQTDKAQPQKSLKKVNGISSVKLYIKEGVLIKHNSMRYHRQPGEPAHHKDPDQPLTWHAGGVAKSCFSDLQKWSIRSRPVFAEMESKVKDGTEARKNAKVPRSSSVPRVARLAPAYIVQEITRAQTPQRSRTPMVAGESSKAPAAPTADASPSVPPAAPTLHWSSRDEGQGAVNDQIAAPQVADNQTAQGSQPAGKQM